MIQVEVVLSPALLHLADVKDKNVVVVDILRATSTIVTAIHEGATSVKTFLAPEEALLLKTEGYITAGESNGHKIEGFDIGNSPFECMNGRVKNQKLALTTTNGTKCFEAAEKALARKIFAGSFLNIKALAKHLVTEGQDVVIICAGWKDKVNMEDSLFAGALVEEMQTLGNLNIDCDSSLICMDLYNCVKNNLMEYLKKSSHYKRLSYLSHDEDMIFCLQYAVFDIVAELKQGEIIGLSN
ncbi:MAG: 2-phosphosulfolactate phosphatase [Bacteroidota bacterium]|nr:2-phosphosulfolactate phosphatase [Bacteroidota bacterium]